MARIVGVIQVAVFVADNRRHAIVGIPGSRNEYLSRLGVAQLIHVHTTARGVVGPIALCSVEGEVHVRFAVTRRNERRALRFEAEFFAIGFRNLLHAHIGKVNDRKQALCLPIVRSRTANKSVFAAKHRRRSRVGGELHLRGLGNGAVRTNSQLVQCTVIARDGIHKPLVLNERRANIAARELNRANKLRQIGGIHTDLAKISADNVVAVDHQATRPVVTAVGNGGASSNGARMNIDALNGAVLHVVAGPIIQGVDIDVVTINGQ